MKKMRKPKRGVGRKTKTNSVRPRVVGSLAKRARRRPSAKKISALAKTKQMKRIKMALRKLKARASAATKLSAMAKTKQIKRVKTALGKLKKPFSFSRSRKSSKSRKRSVKVTSKTKLSGAAALTAAAKKAASKLKKPFSFSSRRSRRREKTSSSRQSTRASSSSSTKKFPTATTAVDPKRLERISKEPVIEAPRKVKPVTGFKSLSEIKPQKIKASGTSPYTKLLSMMGPGLQSFAKWVVLLRRRVAGE